MSNRRPNPLKIDPTGTATQRRKLESAILGRLRYLKKQIVQLVDVEDAFGLRSTVQQVHRESVVNDLVSNLASTQVDIKDVDTLTTIFEIQASIDEEDLVELETESHITVRYGLHDPTPQQVNWIVSQYPSVEVELQGLTIFPAKEEETQQGSPQYDVLKIDVKSKDLEKIHRHLGLIPNTTTFPNYHAHLTIAYLKPGTGQKYVGKSRLEGKRLTFDSITYSDSDRNKTELLLNVFCPTGKGGGVDPTCSPSVPRQRDSGYDIIVTSTGGKVEALRNPTEREAIAFLKEYIKETRGDPFRYPELRGVSDGKNIWIWKAGQALHHEATDSLHLDHQKLSESGGLMKMKSEGNIQYFYSRKKDTGSFLREGLFVTNIFKETPTINAGIWRFITDSQKVEEFVRWVRNQISVAVLGKLSTAGVSDPDHWLLYHIQNTFSKAMGEAYDYVKKPELQKKMDFYLGTKAQFLQDSFFRPVSQERVKLLAGRAFNELSGMTDKMATQMQRSLTDGFIRGDSPRDIARQLVKDVDGLGKKQARTIARTECLVGDTLVDGAEVNKAFRRWYSGPVCEIVTATGKSITVTPNHPILTQDGWVSAGLINESHCLVCTPRINDIGLSSQYPNVKRSPSKISEIFDSVRAVGVCERVCSSQPDFHGDGMDGEVDIASTYRKLSIGNFAPIQKPLLDKIFSESGRSSSRFCDLCGMLLPVDKSACLLCSSKFNSLFTKYSFDDFGIHSKGSTDAKSRLSVLIPVTDVDGVQVCKELVRNSACFEGVDSGIGSRPTNTCLPYNFSDLLLIGSNYLSDFRLTKTRQVQLDNVISVTLRPFSGHVYNLQTDCGYFTIANGIVSGNTIRAHNEGQLEALESLGVEDVGVVVEWSTSDLGLTSRGNPSPCPLCSPLKGTVWKIKEARGMLPRHPNCMCSWVPAGVGEDTRQQKRTQQKIQAAIAASLKAERPKRKKTDRLSRWAGRTAKISRKRPRSILED